MSIHCNPKVITDNLILYLDAANKKSYPKYGLNNWGDLSKYKNHFQKIGNIINDSNAFLFNKNVENYFASYDNFMLPTKELTVEIWFLPDLISNEYVLYSVVSNDSKTIYQSIINQQGLKIFGPRSSFNTNILISDNTWKCITRTSLRSLGTEKIYMNGNLMYENTVPIDPTINFDSNGIILLGQISDTLGDLNPVFSFSGKIAIFKLYNKVLTADQVKSNFNALKGRFYPYTTINN